MKSTKPSQSTSIDRSYQSPPPRKTSKAQESHVIEVQVSNHLLQMHLQLGKLYPPRHGNTYGHPWKNQLIKVTTGTTVKSLAFKAAVFEIFKVSADQKSFRLARHHFLSTLLTSHPDQRIQLLTAQEMYKKKYVGSPLLPKKKWVLGRAESFSSPQNPQSSDLNAVTSKRPLLPVRQLMPLELLDKKQSGVKSRGECYKSIESICAGLISHDKQAQTLEEFQAAEFVQCAMNDMSSQARRNSVYPTAFESEKNTILHACMSYPVPANFRRERKREEADLGNRLQPYSKVKMGTLSPSSQWRHAQGLRMKLGVCEAKEEQMVAINSDEAKSLLQTAFGCIGTKEEKSGFKQSILEVLMKADKHKNDQDKMDGNEISLFTSQICETLDAESHKLSGNDKQVRYDYQMKCLGLAYFLDYGKSGYNRLKESSTNERELSYLRGGDGAHAVCFSAQFADALQGRKEPVKETGFTASKNGTTLSFAEEILSIVEDSLNGEEATTTSEKDKDPYFEPATYVNVFRARTARNQTFNVAYFFNSGSLDADDVLRQLLHVIAALEFVDLKVMLQMSDAEGAGNTSALALLTSNKCNRFPHGKPPVASVAYTNPLAPSRLIYAPFCSGLKHSKNMLAYRLLVNEGKVISWKEVIALYHHLKENCEYSMNVHELRGLRRSVAYPDQFTRQNVNDAKKVFEEETILYQCQWLTNKIGCTPGFFVKLLEEFKNKDGCGDEILEGNVQQLLKDKLSTLPAGTSNKDLMEKRRSISMSTDISEIQKVSIFPHDMTIDDKMKSWLNIIGKAENGSSYSEVLMDNDAFKDYAAASMLTQGIKEWFKKIILGQADVMFDSLCQKINLKLLKFLMSKEQGKKKHIDEEESKNSLQLRKEIGFLSSMRFYAEETLQSQVYLDKCYNDSFLRSSNRGRLTLGNEQYFYFEVMLMKKVSASVDQEKLGNDPDVTANVKDDILKNDELLEVFLDCSKGNVYLGKLIEKKKIFAELVDKVINARFSEEIRAYREEHTERGTKSIEERKEE
eukprot:jgi/Psemu1/23564/gm1.23564_g